LLKPILSYVLKPAFFESPRLNNALKSLTVKPEVELELGNGDHLLNSEELAGFELFGGLKKRVSVEKFPGAIVLRRFSSGEMICRQGDAGNSGFYITRSEDVAKVVGESKAGLGRDATVPVAAAILLDNNRRIAATKGWFDKLNPFSKSKNQRSSNAAARTPDMIANDGPVDIDYETRKGFMFAGDVFGEMSCMTLAPRSATVVAEQDCYVIEFLRSIFDQLQKDIGYREKVDTAYRERVLNGHLRRLQVFEGVNEKLLDRMAEFATLHVYEPGDIIFNEAEFSDSVFIVRSGIIQVVAGVNTGIHSRDVNWEKVCELLGGGAAAESNDQAKEDLNPPTSKPSVADILAAAKGGGVSKPKAPAAGKPSVADILAAAKGGGATEPKAPAAGKPSVADILAAAKGGGAAEPKAPAAGKPSVADILAGAKGGGAKSMPAVSKAVKTVANGALGEVLEFLPADTQAVVESVNKAPGAINEIQTATLAAGFNELLNRRDMFQGRGFTTLVDDGGFVEVVGDYPKGLAGVKKAWSPIQVRTANYHLLNRLLENLLPETKQRSGPKQVLAYLSRGECLGEMGVINNAPRTATCIAYDHAVQDTGIRPGRVELVRIESSAFLTVLKSSAELRNRADDLVLERTAELQMDTQEFIASAWDTTPDFQNQGLAQGQNLLLIDLDACTRCGDCVEACIDSHDDGYSRLFLDGPQFDRFLVPAACRQCFNPSCMIGCPVGSIQRGDDGQIVIEDWCIGCSLCERQCPYDSIQMHDVGWIMEQSVDWEYSVQSCASTDWQTGGRQGQWMKSISPFSWTIDFQKDLVAISPEHWSHGDPKLSESVLFRSQFSVAIEETTTAEFGRLTIVCKSLTPTAWLNGVPLELSQDARQAKRGVFEGMIDSIDLVSRKINWIAVAVDSPEGVESRIISDGDMLMSLRLDPIQSAGVITYATADGVALPVVEVPTERAVVCDMCNDLHDNGPACVSQCPHEAAIRVNASQFFARSFNR
jgi:Fe-S-cluster-containing hydrogenase component 2/CRP-like cAMP-binding protein